MHDGPDSSGSDDPISALAAALLGLSEGDRARLAAVLTAAGGHEREIDTKRR